MATLETRQPASASARRPTARRVRVVIRRVNPLSVLKFSLIFYFCLTLVVLVGLGILWAFLSAMGVIDRFATLMGELVGAREFEVDAGYVFRLLGLIGLVSSALWAAVTVFIAFLYNLIADLVGGIEVTLAERR